MPRLLFAFFTFLAATNFAATAAEIARVLPPPGIKISDADRAELEKQTAELQRAIDGLHEGDNLKPAQKGLVPDVAVYAKAVRFALLNGEFFDPKDVAKAKNVLKSANERLQQLKANKAAWPTTPGPQVRAYRSRIDDSLQPYGLELPEKFDASKPYHLVVWLRGRSDKGTDMHFIAEREKKKGEFQFANAIILHPLGRHCNAYKFAGEVDVFEAIEDVQRRYKTEGKPVIMGFSMGGAGCWHLAAHYPDYWQAASPGAGFVDVKRYQGLSGDKLPEWYVQELWNWYDVPPYTKQLAMLPLYSYSGELDKQKASADIMDEEYKKVGEKLKRIIGRDMPHKYDKPSIAEITKWVESEMKKSSTPIKYQGPHYQNNKPGQKLTGPIDMAFCDKFIFVAPSGKSSNPKVNAWVEQEMQHQLRRWRELYRGEVTVVKDTDLTTDQMVRANLILWGDAESNKLIGRYAKNFPIVWDAKTISAGKQTVASEDHVLVGIYPKQLLSPDTNAKLDGYVVINSGPTFREGHDKTNSQQTPKLPDWAVIDITTAPSDTAPGKVVNAGFFDKDWKFVEPVAQKKALGY
jgi:hypothetical protein